MKRFFLIGLYTIIDVVMFVALVKWLGASEIVAAFIVLAVSVNGVRAVLEEHAAEKEEAA